MRRINLAFGKSFAASAFNVSNIAVYLPSVGSVAASATPSVALRVSDETVRGVAVLTPEEAVGLAVLLLDRAAEARELVAAGRWNKNHEGYE